MNRLFVTVPDGASQIDIVGEDLRHLQVLRIQPHDIINIGDGTGRLYKGTVVSVQKNRVVLSLGDTYFGENEPCVNVVIYQALCKGEKNDFIVQKAVELGARGIVFYHSRNCIGGLSGREDAKLRRWSLVAKSAAEQCGREIIPYIQYAGDFTDMLCHCAASAQKLFFYEKGTQLFSQFMQEQTSPFSKDICVVIGSEGGFTSAEAQSAQESGFTILSLGKRILRAETVPIAVLSVLMTNFGEM